MSATCLHPIADAHLHPGCAGCAAHEPIDAALRELDGKLSQADRPSLLDRDPTLEDAEAERDEPRPGVQIGPGYED